MQPVVTLDTRGVLQDPNQKLEQILLHLLATESLQSNIFRDQVVSIPRIVQQYGNNPIELSSNLENMLDIVYGHFFENVVVEVTVNDSDEAGKFTVVIMLRVQENNNWYDLASSLYVKDGRVSLHPNDN